MGAVASVSTEVTFWGGEAPGGHRRSRQTGPGVLTAMCVPTRPHSGYYVPDIFVGLEARLTTDAMTCCPWDSQGLKRAKQTFINANDLSR